MAALTSTFTSLSVRLLNTMRSYSFCELAALEFLRLSPLEVVMTLDAFNCFNISSDDRIIFNAVE